MTDTERYINGTCERIVSSGYVWLYRDLYKDLRQQMPCGEACRLIEEGLRRTRQTYLPMGGGSAWRRVRDRAHAIAALKRLARWAEDRELDREYGWLYGK